MRVRYVAITPARDEERLLPGLIASMVRQTNLPARWIIIDDGSADATARIVDEAARAHPWIEPHHLESGRPREAGGESVVMRFLPREAWQDAEFIFRLDADLSFDSGMIEQLMDEFERDSKLGIASATLYEPKDGAWIERVAPGFHTRGATKMYSRACFEAIGGLEGCEGWDTIDEMRAAMLGFRTRSFRHIHARHHRPQGAAGASWRVRMQKGRTAYYIGYAPLFMIARALRNCVGEMGPVGGMLMLAGYLDCYLKRRPMVRDRELVRFVRRQQMRRLVMLPSVWR